MLHNKFLFSTTIFSLIIPNFIFAYNSELNFTDLSDSDFKPVKNNVLAGNSQQLKGFNKDIRLTDNSIKFHGHDYASMSSYNSNIRCRTGINPIPIEKPVF